MLKIFNQTRAAGKRTTTDARDGVRDIYARQSCAVFKRTLTDTHDGVTENYTRQTRTALKRHIIDCRDGVGDSYEIAEEYNGEYYPWYDLEHCVCMYGYDIDNGEIYISDPQQGNITVSAYEFEEIYDEIGRYSMTLIDTKDI